MNQQTSFNCRFFLNRFPEYLDLFVFLFLVTPCLAVAVHPCMEWIPIKKKILTCPLSLWLIIKFYHYYLLTAIWLFHGQLWTIFKGTASLFQWLSLCFLQFQSKGHQKPHRKAGSILLAEHLVGFEPGTFQFLL